MTYRHQSNGRQDCFSAFSILLASVLFSSCGLAPSPPSNSTVAEGQRQLSVAPTRDEKTALAMKAVFGSDAGGTIQVGEKSVSFVDGKVVETRGARVLIVSGTARSSAHPDPGYVGIWYLGGAASSPTVTSSFPEFVATGTFGNAPDWKIRDDLTDNRVLEVIGFGMWHGHAYTWTSLVELGRKAPRMLIDRARTGYDWDPGDDPTEVEPAASIESAITYNKARDRFEIKYSGTAEGTQVYVRKGRTYVPTKRLPQLHKLGH